MARGCRRYRLDKFTFAHGAVMRFAKMFDVILELAVSLRQNRAYDVSSTRRKKTGEGWYSTAWQA
jgi:hypothetical protein